MYIHVCNSVIVVYQRVMCKYTSVLFSLFVPASALTLLNQARKNPIPLIQRGSILERMQEEDRWGIGQPIFTWETEKSW